MANKSSLNKTLNWLKSGPMQPVIKRMPMSMKVRLRGLVDRVAGPSKFEQLAAQVSQTNDLLARLMYERAMESPRAQEPKRLLGKGFKVYSQHDEDGIIEEIFRRIGTTNHYFVEFGVGDGTENCTTYCLLKGWSGAWIDGSAACYEAICRNMAFLMNAGRLSVLYSFITAENIESLFQQMKVPREFDFLSIDIDYNDYWIWNAIQSYSPRVVAVEYNASFKQTVACTVPYSATTIWGYTNYFGTSLKALETLAHSKGYCLVGCNYTGVTAFFVREDLVGDHFAAPYTSENHYEPPRYFIRMPNGHPPAFGPVELVRSRLEVVSNSRTSQTRKSP